MKTVKFKDLPEKVQEFCSRIGYAWIGNIVDTEWLHTKADWSRSTDEERLAYAEWMYKDGVTCLLGRIKRKDKISHPLRVVGSQISDKSNNCLYYLDDNKWAEIISEPEKEERERIEKTIKEMAKESIASGAVLINKEEPTFKAGDEVEGSFDSKFFTDEYYFYTGGKNSRGYYICEGATKNGALYAFPIIRKPDPDKVYREIAKEIMNARYLIQETYFSNTEGSRHSFDREFLEETLIEAIKKGKEL